MKLPNLNLLLQKVSFIVRRFGLADRWLLLAVVLGFALGAQGLGWGKYDCLNPDSMAFRSLFTKDRPPMHPGEFLKPPLYTYVNHFVARLPATALSAPFYFLGKSVQSETYFRIRLLLGRLLNLALFAGLVVMVYWLVCRHVGVLSARMAAWLFATSAGMVPFQIFLTTDLALLFMMTLSFVFACKIVETPSMRISVLAGLLAGLATATKYNGLAVAAALPLAHLLTGSGNRILQALRRPSAWACGAAVPVGFLIGNPYALLDWPKFHSDFFYNYTITPVYGGQTATNGYAVFFQAYPEIFGWPTLVLLALGVAASFLVVLGPVQLRPGGARALWILAAAVVAIYTWKIGAFPRIKTRFVLPMAPFILVLASVGFPALLRWRVPVLGAVSLAVLYNLICGWWTGEIFRRDPRMDVISIVKSDFERGTLIEMSKSIPPVGLMAGKDFRTIRMPSGIGRAALFDEMFSDNEEMQKLKGHWKPKHGPEWFTAERRRVRNPGAIIWSSNDVEKVVTPEFEALLRPESSYRVVFDRRSPERPWWVYPRDPDFVINRTVAWLKRE